MFARTFRSRWFAAVMGATLTAVVAGGSAVLANHQSDGLIHGCVKNRTGVLRVVNSPSECDPKSETPIEWNRQGRDGQDGAPGLPGNLALAGKQCPAGQVVSGFNGDGDLVCTAPGDGSSEADADADGFTIAAGDCNDTNPTVHPGAPEIADGHDNDCDGSADEDIAPSCNDGNPYTFDYSDEATGGCVHELVSDVDWDDDGFDASQAGGPDCDDGDAFVNPDQTEVHGDAIDNDCNGFVDDSQALNETDTDEEADFCKLEFPSVMTLVVNDTSETVYGQVLEWGLTEGFGAEPRVRAELGYGPDGSDPRSTPGWRFTGAEFERDLQLGGNEYRASLVAPSSPGTYSYAYRFSFDEGVSHTYCDLDGAGSDGDAEFTPNALGTMTVLP